MSVRVLLDTHALLWWLAGDERLPPDARAIVAAPENVVYVSAASAWEVATKYRLGKLPGARALALDFAACVASQGFADLPISVEHAAAAGLLAIEHRDPFDRMLIAQSLALGLPLVSNEALFDRFGVTRLW